MATITKRELAIKITDQLRTKGHEITQQDVLEVVQTLIDEITDSLAHGDTVVMRNFGAFQVREMKAKVGRNPKDPGKDVPIPKKIPSPVSEQTAPTVTIRSGSNGDRIEGVFREQFGVSGQQYSVPELLSGATNLGFMVLPNYRAWVVFASLVICLGTWYTIERTRLGAYLRAGTENPALVQAFGINVPTMVTLTYAGGAGLAALAGVLAAPVIQITPLMGSNLIIVEIGRAHV